MSVTTLPEPSPRARVVADVERYVHAMHGAQLALLEGEPIAWVDTAEVEREVYGEPLPNSHGDPWSEADEPDGTDA